MRKTLIERIDYVERVSARKTSNKKRRHERISAYMRAVIRMVEVKRK
ncbi:hypothetical protein NYE48_28100 [Paenibacillus sp. FSL M7-1455]